MSDYLRMSGIYWSLTLLDLCGAKDSLDRDELIKFLKRNQHESGGFSPSDGHDPHLLYSLSALQVYNDFTCHNLFEIFSTFSFFYAIY